MKFSCIFTAFNCLGCGIGPFLNGQQATVSRTATAQALSNPDTPDSCPHLFTSGNSGSATFIQYCVTDSGAITSIQTPFGHFQIGTRRRLRSVSGESGSRISRLRCKRYRELEFTAILSLTNSSSRFPYYQRR